MRINASFLVIAAALLIIGIFAGLFFYEQQQTTPKDQIKQLTQTILSDSYEGYVVIGEIQANHVTDAFVKTHGEYLMTSAEDSNKQLKSIQISKELTSEKEQIQKLLAREENDFSILQKSQNNKNELIKTKEDLQNISQTSNKLYRSL